MIDVLAQILSFSDTGTLLFISISVGLVLMFVGYIYASWKKYDSTSVSTDNTGQVSTGVDTNKDKPESYSFYATVPDPNEYDES